MEPGQEITREFLGKPIGAEIESLEPRLEPSESIRRDVPAPTGISSLPPEVLTKIFAFLRVRVTSVISTLCGETDQPDPLAWLRVAHVCHRWREIALNQPHFWSHVDFTTFTSAGVAEILARARDAPLHLEARVPGGYWDDARFSAFQKELQDHASRICQLGFSADPANLHGTLERLRSPAPTLEFLSLLSHDRRWQVVIPDTLFNGSTPRLSWLELWNCDINWTSPLLRGLEYLEIRSPVGKPSLWVWLGVLEAMSQLKTLILHFASPIAPPGTSLQSDIERTVTIPSLTLFEFSSPVIDCGYALAHLVLPALTSLCLIIIPNSRDVGGDDVQEILPLVARHAHGPQDTQPLRSVLFHNDVNSEILAWTLPNMDVALDGEFSFYDHMHSARVAITVTSGRSWSSRTHTKVFSAVMAALPLGNLMTLTAQNYTRPLDEQFWLRHAPRWALLRRVRLWAPAVRGFREMLEDNEVQESPVLPSLKKLVLIDVALRPYRTLHLCDALRRRAELGVPLESLDLRRCLAASRQVDLFNDIVVEVLGPLITLESSGLILQPEDSSGTED